MKIEAQIQFPVTFPIKVVGRTQSEVGRLARAIIERHAGPLEQARVSERASGDRNYIAVTYVIEAQSREQLDSIYRELTACTAVLVAL